MLTVETMAKIRRYHFVEGRSIKEISRLLRIPEQVGHQFRSNPATDSVSFRPGIPVESGH